MADPDALLAACLAEPDADLPRLLYADALADAGDDAYADFVRAQVALANTPPWEPLAVRARRRHPELLSGAAFRDRLPPTGNALAGWHPDAPFRRGLGWAVKVWQLGDLLAVGDRLFASAPAGELHLPNAPRDDWKLLAGRPWLARVRTLRFTGLNLPIESVRTLGEVPGGVTDVYFQRADSPAAGELFGGLARSPLGRQLAALHLRNGYAADLEELLDELDAGGLRVGTLSLVMMGLSPRTAPRLARGLLDRVHTLDLSHCNRLGDAGLQAATPAGGFPRLRSLTAARVGAGDGAIRWACWAGSLAGLNHLDLSDNQLGPEGLRPFDRDTPPAGLRSLGLSGCGVTDLGVKHLTASAVWPNLVELDLRFNQVGDPGARHLLTADTPPDLTALLLTVNPISERLRAKLRAKYGPAVVLDDG